MKIMKILLLLQKMMKKKKDDSLPIIPHYSFNVEKLYMDLDIDMENIPYF